MKTISLLLAMVGGAGFFYRGQLQSLVGSSHRQAPEGVYYLRSAHTFAVPGGTVRWSAGRELRLAPQTADAGEVLTLTDGRSVSRIARTNVMRDMDDATALRQIDDANVSNERRLAQQQQAARFADRAASNNFYGAPEVNRSATYAPATGTTVVYPVYQDFRTVIIQRPAPTPPPVRVMATTQTIVPPQIAPQPRSTPVPRATPVPPTIINRN